MKDLSLLSKEQTLIALQNGELLVNLWMDHRKNPNAISYEDFKVVFHGQYAWSHTIKAKSESAHLKARRAYLTKKLGPCQCKVQYRELCWAWGLLYKNKFTITITSAEEGEEYLIDNKATLAEALEISTALSQWLK